MSECNQGGDEESESPTTDARAESGAQRHLAEWSPAPVQGRRFLGFPRQRSLRANSGPSKHFLSAAGGRACIGGATCEGNLFQLCWSHLVNTHYNYCLLEAIGAH